MIPKSKAQVLPNYKALKSVAQRKLTFHRIISISRAHFQVILLQLMRKCHRLKNNSIQISMIQNYRSKPKRRMMQMELMMTMAPRERRRSSQTKGY